MNPDECRSRFDGSPVATLATVGAAGPHLVPIVFALDGDRLVSAVDHKPKRTRHLQRLANIAENPAVALLADAYDDDWDKLWWVRADGIAHVITAGPAMRQGTDLLVDRYEQYRNLPPRGPLIVISIQRWSGWSASGS